MLKKQFEDFLVDLLFDINQINIRSGFRYQFKSPDFENSTKLFSFITDRKSGTIFDGDIELPFLDIYGIKLIVVLHGESEKGFTENYISRLRDLVASETDSFSNSSLLIIHNSMLDTIINSSQDLADLKKVWSPLNIKNKLEENLNKSNDRNLTSINLINLIYDRVIELEETVFGFKSLYDAISGGELNFYELGFLNDDSLAQLNDLNQIRGRLEQNKYLFDKIKEIIDKFPHDLESKFSEELDFGKKFVKDKFDSLANWHNKLDYYECVQEQQKNQKALLVFEDFIINQCLKSINRNKSDSKSGKRDKHLIVQLKDQQDCLDLELVFTGDKITENEVILEVKKNKKICNSELNLNSKEIITFSGINSLGGKRSKVLFSVNNIQKPTYFKVKLKRSKNIENFTFNILILPYSEIDLKYIENNFLLKVDKNSIVIQTDEDKIRISPFDINYNLENSNQILKYSQTGIVDFSKLINDSSEINFKVDYSAYFIDYIVECARPSESLSLPLLFDNERFYQLFNPEYFGVFKEPNKVILDNTEFLIVGRRLTLLKCENYAIKNNLIYVNEVNNDYFSINDILDNYDDLNNAYSTLFDYLNKHKTLISISGWDDEFKNIVKNIVYFYNIALEKIEFNKPLSDAEVNLLKVGMYIREEDYLFAPWHPLILSYYLNLVDKILHESKSQIGSNFSHSFCDLPKITKDKLNPQGLIPYLHKNKSSFFFTQIEKENLFWINILSNQETNINYIRKLVYDKLIAFKEAYKFILDSKNESLLIVNSINNADNLEILYGIIDFYKDFKVYSPKIHVNIYDSKYHRTCFDELADSVISEDLKSSLGINNGKYKDDMAQLLDILNTKLTYSKHELSSTREYKYAHISFFKNNAEVECTDVDPTQQLSGVLSNGLIVGEASVSNNNIFYTTFGLKNIDIENYIHLNIANKINRLFKSYIQPNVQYSPHNSIALSVSGLFKTELDKVYDNSIWTCIIDPKVTLDFFSSSKDIVLIHYSDSYTNSTNYDAITVTKQTDLYRAVLEVNHNEGYIEEFNAFNGEWLLKMITDNHNERKAKKGIIGAYKFVSCLLSQSSIIWIPISVAEMIRVSGNIGLSMSDSDFARILHMGTTKGAMSDDILFVGFKDNNLYLLPVEVKTGKRASHNYGIQQAQNLKEFLEKGLLGRSGLAGNIYRGLFIRQILMQIEKYKLYSLYNENYFNALIERREWWLQGNYNLGKLENYFETILYSNVEDSNLTEPEFTPQDKNLKIEVPIGFLDFFISKPLQMLTNDLTNTIFKYIDKQYILDNWDSFLSVQNEPKVQLKTLESFIS
ncbi:TPA: DNA phosphorothioation-dependent restriction protein DptH, partial [Acinetobacter baumannii]|nr:DNA phosphorothioation-dependent restriction protein DptH [Acinetobacter baumannii]